MNANEVSTRIQRKVSNLTNAVFTSQWYMDRANAGYRALGTFYDEQKRRALRFPEFQTTRDKTITVPMASGTNTWAVSDADIFSITSMWDLTNDRVVYERNIRELESSDPTLEGQLLKYAIVGTGTAVALRLYKIPTVSTDVRLGVYLYPETLTISGDGPVLPPAWHEGVVLLGAADAADDLGIYDRRDDLYNQALAFVRRTRAATQETRRRKRYFPVWRRTWYGNREHHG